MRDLFSRIILGGTLLLLAMSGRAADQPGWWVEAGAFMRGGMQLKLSGSSYVQMLGSHAAAGPLSAPTGVGAIGQYADRTYDDGYVKLALGTSTPASAVGLGQTWNWAYDAASQYTASSATLAFHAANSGYTTTADNSLAISDDPIELGLQAAIGIPVRQSGRWRFDLGLDYQMFWDVDSEYHDRLYAESVDQLQITDTYDVSAAIHPTLGFPPPRTAPGGYVGTFDGPLGTTNSGWAGGFLAIPNLPTTRTNATLHVATACNDVRLHLKTDFYQLALAPRLRYALSDAVRFLLTPKIGAAYVEIQAERSEVFRSVSSAGTSTVLQRWSDHARHRSLHFATGIALGVEIDLGDGFYAGASGGYDWTVSEARFDIGPNTAALDPTGFTTAAVLGVAY